MCLRLLEEVNDLNIYLFELRAQRRNLIIWTIAIVILQVVFMAGIYPTFYESMNDVLAILKNFPPVFSEAFGLNAADLFSYSGFFSFSFSYLALMGAIMAAAIAVSTFAREKRSKCVDFLLTKPKNRGSIYGAKLLSGLTALIITNIVFLTAAAAVYMSGNQGAFPAAGFILAACGLFFTQLVFLALGTLWAVSAKKVRSVSGIATAFGFAGFILSALAGFLEEETWIRLIAPLKYFDPASIFWEGGYKPAYVAIAVLLITVCLTLSFLKFCKTDTPAA